MVNKFVKARPTQSLEDVVEMHYDLTSPDWELVSIQVSKTFCETEEVNKIRCEPTMPAGVVYDMGMCYLYGDFRLKNNGKTATTGSTADTGLRDSLQMLMSMRKQYDYLPTTR